MAFSSACHHKKMGSQTISRLPYWNKLWYSSLWQLAGLIHFLRITFGTYEYRWADGVNIKKPIEVSAPKYVDYLMGWIETQLDDESIFSQNLGG